MSELTDIPVREARDGAEQLTYLRAYLKDTGTEKVYPDSFLINMLVIKTPVKVWSEFVRASVGDKPFTYDPLDIYQPINRVRVLTGDTVELTLKHTDVEILKQLEVLPLRYLVYCFNTLDSDESTMPTDDNNPVHILRMYLGDEDATKYTDKRLVELLLRSGMNPFGFILNSMERDTSASVAINSGGGQTLASFDGISFGNPLNETDLKESDRNLVAQHFLRSIYERESVYCVMSDGVNLTDVDWETRWYAI